MLCAVLISVTFCSSTADRWPGSNRRFWTNPFLIIANAPIISGPRFPHPAALDLRVIVLP